MRRWLSRLGLPGAVALLALAIAAPLAAWFTPQWQQQARSLRLAADGAPRLATVPALSALTTLPAIPDTGEPAERVADLLALALRHGVAVLGTQQRLERQGPVQRLQLTLSARAGHAELRAFVTDALQADAALALDALRWRREAAAAGRLDAELQWSLLRLVPSPVSSPSPSPSPSLSPSLTAAASRSGAHPASPTQARPPLPAPPPRALLAWSAPAAPATALPTARPAPPAFPYQWIGQLDDGNGAQALLSGPQRSFGARAGEVLDGRWRLDAIAAAALRLTWLPSGEAVTVDRR